jgi:hypothetical protein
MSDVISEVISEVEAVAPAVAAGEKDVVAGLAVGGGLMPEIVAIGEKLLADPEVMAVANQLFALIKAKL